MFMVYRRYCSDKLQQSFRHVRYTKSDPILIYCPHQAVVVENIGKNNTKTLPNYMALRRLFSRVSFTNFVLSVYYILTEIEIYFVCYHIQIT